MEEHFFENEIYQRISGTNKGDCMKCSLATLFNKKYDEVPNFIEYKDWYEQFKYFLKINGYFLDEFLYNNTYWNKYVNFKYEYFTNKLNQETISLAKGVKIKGEKIMLGTVISPSLYDNKKDLINQTLHMVLCDDKCNIVFDPNINSNKEEYPLQKEIGYNGLIEVWTLKSFNL